MNMWGDTATMGRREFHRVSLRNTRRHEGLLAIGLVCLVSMMAPQEARADVPPPEEDACSGGHRAGDRCFTDNEELHPTRLDGTCQTSSCPRWKREPVPCLKCVANPAGNEKGTAREAAKKASHTQGATDASNACSLVRPGSAARRITLWLAAGAILPLLLVVRRRRGLSGQPGKSLALSNKPLKLSAADGRPQLNGKAFDGQTMLVQGSSEARHRRASW